MWEYMQDILITNAVKFSCESCTAPDSNFLSDILFPLLALIVSIFAIFFAFITTHKNNKITQCQIILEIQKMDMENRERLSHSYKELKILSRWLKEHIALERTTTYNLTFSKFYKELNKDRYRNLRGMLYFYEYIGSVVKMHEISYNQIFSLIYFPDDLNNKLKYIISKTRKMKPEFLENYCCLRSKFEKTRRKNECYCQIKK